VINFNDVTSTNSAYTNLMLLRLFYRATAVNMAVGTLQLCQTAQVSAKQQMFSIIKDDKQW